MDRRAYSIRNNCWIRCRLDWKNRWKNNKNKKTIKKGHYRNRSIMICIFSSGTGTLFPIATPALSFCSLFRCFDRDRKGGCGLRLELESGQQETSYINIFGKGAQPLSCTWPGTFKTEPCWKQLLDFDKKKSIRRYAETVDPVVSGQKSSLGRMDVQENEISKKELLPTPMGRALPGLVRHRVLQKKNRL